MASAETKTSKKPQDSAFQQQRLEACHPLLTPNLVIGLFTIVGILFVIIGAVIMNASNNIVEFSARYDDLCPANTSVGGPGVPCQVSINITKEMKAPIFFYFKLTQFYQNHRRYVKSRADPQLRGENVLSDLSSCDPLESWNGSSLYPCGLIANSFFNDTFFGSLDGTTLTYGGDWREHDIAWESDKKVKFVDSTNPSAYDPRHRTGPGGFPLPNVTNEHFIVWMRTAGLPTFRKLYARIPEKDFPKGSIFTANISSVFPTSSFDGEKWIVLSTSSWIGGKNDFLGTAYLVVGILCLIFAAFFLAKHCHSPRKSGEMTYFNWRGGKTTVTAGS